MVRTRKPPQSRSKQTVAVIVEAGFIAVARVPNIPVKAYIMIQVGIATLVHQLSDENAAIGFTELAEGMTAMVRYMIEGGLRDARTPGEASRRDPCPGEARRYAGTLM